MSNASNIVYVSKKLFPDNAFRSYLREYFADGDGKLDTDSVTAITVDRQGVKSLQGIELFHELHLLSCAGNEIETVILNENPNLHELDCCDNKVSMLSVNGCKELDIIRCAGNCLSYLDLSSVKPRYIDCSDNELKSFELGENKRLEELHCRSNDINVLNVSQCPKLNEIDVDDYMRRGNGEYYRAGTKKAALLTEGREKR